MIKIVFFLELRVDKRKLEFQASFATWRQIDKHLNTIYCRDKFLTHFFVQ